MNVANKDLCAELEELSGWGDTEKTYAGFSNVPDKDVELTNTTNPLFGHDIYKIAPAYDLGFLLRKLPRYDISFNGILHTVTFWDDDTDKEFVGEGTTVENATAALCIELIKQDILPKGSEE